MCDIDETGSLQSLALQDAEPVFNLVKPRSVGWRKVKMDVGMALKPAVVGWLVCIEIVQDDMNFFVLAVGGNDCVHEIQKLPASAPFVMAPLNQTSGSFKSREQSRCAMPFVFMSKATDSSSARQSDVTLSPF